MKTKAFAIMAAVMMLAVAGIAVVEVSDKSDATTIAGTVKVYYYDEANTQWGSKTETAYNLYIAADNAASTLGYTISTNNSVWKSGYNPDKDYGLITAINSSSNFKIYGYNNADSAWNDITNYPLGWFRPYEDYTAVNVDGHYAAYANVAIVTQNGQGTYYDYTTITGMIDLTEVQDDSDFLCSFYLADATGRVSIPAGTQVKVFNGTTYEYQTITTQDIEDGITVYGYGSDAYLALLDAVGASLSGQMTAYIAHTGYYTYYSWMNTLFGIGTTSTTQSGVTTYYYWEALDPNAVSPGDEYLQWTLGYYSPVHFDSNQVLDEFWVIYDYS